MCTPLFPSFVADANLLGNVKTAEEIIFVRSRFEIVVFVDVVVVAAVVVVVDVVVVVAAVVIVVVDVVVDVEDFERLNCHELTS